MDVESAYKLKKALTTTEPAGIDEKSYFKRLRFSVGVPRCVQWLQTNSGKVVKSKFVVGEKSSRSAPTALVAPCCKIIQVVFGLNVTVCTMLSKQLVCSESCIN